MHFALVLFIAAFCDAAAADLLEDLRENLYQNNEDYIQSPSPAPRAAPLATTKREAYKPLSKYREIKPARKTEFVFPSVVRRMNELNETQPEAFTKPDQAATNAVPQLTGETGASPARARAQSAASRANDLATPAFKPHQLQTRTKDEQKQSKNEKEPFEILNPVSPTGISNLAPKMRGAGGVRPAVRRGGAQRVRVRARKHRAHRGGREGHVTAPRDFVSTPRPDLLDMAPARGPRVHAKRLRNRLCQRSVLKPEGPKYDSQGKIYLHKFTPRGRGHYDFNMTRPPALMLPRCCNCCQKSVLGCE